MTTKSKEEPEVVKVDRVLAIDPGKMTGLAWIRQESGLITLENSVEADPDTIIEAIRPTLAEWPTPDGVQPPLKVVIEKFIVNSMTASRSQEVTYALETIGAVKQACRDVGYPLHAITWQTPADAKNTFNNDKLKKLGLWHRGGAGHANDAIRHGALYLAKMGLYAKMNESK